MTAHFGLPREQET
jgi:hypothetical protein